MTTLVRISLLFLGMILLWQMLVWLGSFPDYILPGPVAVWQALLTSRNLIAANSLATLNETLLGLCGGVVFGMATALMLVICRPLGRWFLPLLIISQAVPTFVVAPLFVIWLGYGMASKIAVAAMMIFFPVASAFYDGLRATPQEWLDLAHTMNAARLNLFWHIRIPAALPRLATGLRLAAVTAPLGAVVGEWVGSSHGLGYLMLYANERMQIDMMFAVLIVIIVLALSLYFLVDKTLRTIIKW